MKFTVIFFSCILILTQTIFSQAQTKNGYSLPTEGTIRVLFAFAEIDNTDPLCGGVASNLHNPLAWPQGELPTNVDGFVDPVIYPSGPLAYISKYYNEMSFGKLNVIGDYIDHVITIPCNMLGFASVPYNKVKDTLRKYIVDYELDPINNPFPTKYGSTPPDHDIVKVADLSIYGGYPKPFIANSKFDVLIIITRNWKNDNGTQKAAGGAILPTDPTFVMGSFTGFDNVGSFKCADGGSIESLQFVVQEYFHTLFGRNIAHTASGAGEHTFNLPTNPWGMCTQVNGTGISNAANAWDRYFLGYYGWADVLCTIPKTNLISSLNPSGLFETPTDFTINSSIGDGLFVIRDQVKYGDAIRIKLPHLNEDPERPIAKEQWLWIENHQKFSQFDVGNFEERDCKEPISPGMYAFIQVGKNDTSGPSSLLYDEIDGASNGLGSWIFPLTAEGNYDFHYVNPHDPSPDPECLWGLKTISIEPSNPLTIPNPLIGYSDLFNYYNSNGDSILNHNSNDAFQPGISELVSGITYYNMHSKGDPMDAFGSVSNNFKMAIGTNPAPVSVYTYKGNDTFVNQANSNQHTSPYENRTIWLNGISIELIQENYNSHLLGPGAILVKIRFDDYDVVNDVRWCGNIKLSQNDFDLTLGDFSDGLYSLKLQDSKKILLDRSRSYTRDWAVDQHPITNEWRFSELTEFTVRPNAFMLMDINSVVEVQAGSTMRLQVGSLLEMKENSSIVVKKDCKLIIENGAHLILQDNAFIKIEDGGTLEYDNSIVELLGDNSVIEFEGNLSIATNAEFTFTGNGFIKFSKVGWINPITNPTNIISATGGKIKLVGTGINDKVLEITQETMYAHLPLAKFTLQNGKAELGNDARLSVDCDITVDNAKITNIPLSPQNHRGLNIFGQANISIQNSTFEKGKYGMYAISTYGGYPLVLKSCRFENNQWGLFTIDKGVTLQSCVFLNNAIDGWDALGMTFPSYVGGGLFKQNKRGGYYHTTGISPLHINKGNIFQNTDNGFEFDGPSMFTFTCGSVTSNGVGVIKGSGVFIKNNAKLNNSPFIAPYGGKSNFSSNENAVRAACASDWYLIGGRNNFSSVGQCAFGTMNTPCTSTTIVSLMNQWKIGAPTPPVVGTNYNLSTCSCSPVAPIILNDALPMTSLSCLSIWIPSPSEKNAIANANPLEKCPGCEKINTTDFSKVKMNEAIVQALSYVAIADTLNEDSINISNKAIDLLHQILTFEYRHNLPNKTLNADEVWLLELAYSKVKELLGRSVSKNQTSANLSSTEVQKVFESIDSLSVRIDFTGSHDKMLYFGLDKAGVYKLINERELALLEIDKIKDCFTHDPEQVAYINTLRNVIFAEMQLQKGFIAKENFEKIFSQLQDGTSPLATGIYTTITSDSTLTQNVEFVGDTVQFKLSETANTNNWNFGDCNTSPSVQPQYVYLTPGQYNITVAQTFTCTSANHEMNLTVLPKPVGEVIQTKTNLDCDNVMVALDKNFTANVLAGCLSNTSAALTTNNLRFKFDWDFTTPTRFDFTEYFSFDSIINDQDSVLNLRIMKGQASKVKLNATLQINQAGKWLNTTYEYIYSADFLNDDDFEYRITMDSSTCQRDSVHFPSIITGGTAPFNIEWDFDDGTSSSSISPTHLFHNSGIHQIDIEVRDANGCLAQVLFEQGSSHIHWGNLDSGQVADTHSSFEITIGNCKSINGFAVEATNCGNAPVSNVYLGLLDQNQILHNNYALSDAFGFFEFSPSFIASLDTNLVYRIVVVRPNNYIVLDRGVYSLNALIGGSPIDVMLGATRINQVSKANTPSSTVILTSVTDANNNTYSTGVIMNSTPDFYTKKTDASSNIIWEATFDGHANGPDTAKSICLDSLGNVYITGVSWNGTDYDFLTIKYDITGLEQWVNAYADSLTSNDMAQSICIDSLGQVCVHGEITRNTITEFATVIYANCVPIEPFPMRSSKPVVHKAVTKNENYTVTIYPNPNNDGLIFIRSTIKSESLTFILTGITGKTIFTNSLTSGNASVKIPTGIISGVYICLIKNNESGLVISKQKLILIR